MSLPDSSKKLGRVVAFTAPLSSVLAIALLVRSGRNSGAPIVVAMIALWVLAPFVAIFVGVRISAQWSRSTRTVLFCASIASMLGSVAVYIADAVHQLRPQAAFPFVITPLVSWGILLVLAPVIAAVARAR